MKGTVKNMWHILKYLLLSLVFCSSGFLTCGENIQSEFTPWNGPLDLLSELFTFSSFFFVETHFSFIICPDVALFFVVQANLFVNQHLIYSLCHCWGQCAVSFLLVLTECSEIFFWIKNSDVYVLLQPFLSISFKVRKATQQKQDKVMFLHELKK